MDEFKNGETKFCFHNCCEVGIDIPQATVMIVSMLKDLAYHNYTSGRVTGQINQVAYFYQNCGENAKN